MGVRVMLEGKELADVDMLFLFMAGFLDCAFRIVQPAPMI